MLVLRASHPEVRDKDDYFLLGFITPVLYEFLYRMFAKYLHNLLLGECLTLSNTVHIFFYCCTIHFDNIKILFTNKCTLLCICICW